MRPLDRLPLARLPTPLEPFSRLGEAWGIELWVKRDDLTGFGLSGNKVRKLEYHLAAARRQGADTVITCGALQSNHCRATALACARLGLSCVLLLRTPDGRPPSEATGNYLLDLLAGAQVRFVTPEEYGRIAEVMGDEAGRVAASGGSAWTIPEGASDWLGMLGMADGMLELLEQSADLPGPIAAIWHAASSGGTTAGLAWAAPVLPLVAVSVGDPARALEDKVRSIWEEAADRLGGTSPLEAPVEYLDRYVGGGYGVVAGEELEVQAEFTRLSGLVLDPTYTGKAVVALRSEAGRYRRGEVVVFWHTGGGFAAFGHDWLSRAGGGEPRR